MSQHYGCSSIILGYREREDRIIVEEKRRRGMKNPAAKHHQQ
jgi:hypothetical protein